MLVADGLGGLPNKTSMTELETARTPNLDDFARASSLGLTDPIGTGITSGSGPAHLALFGYDPIQHQIGRGVLEALGSGLEVTERDLCIRANFCTLDPTTRKVINRRAGRRPPEKPPAESKPKLEETDDRAGITPEERLPTEKNHKLVTLIRRRIRSIEDIEVILRSGEQHRFVVMFRGAGLSDKLTDSDPERDGHEPLLISALNPTAAKSRRIVNEFVRQVSEAIKDEPVVYYKKGESVAYHILLRGYSMKPKIEPMSERYGLKAACAAVYPMYRGLAQLVGMEILPTGRTWSSELDTVAQHLTQHDFFFTHLKELDSRGEDGDFDGKQKCIERLDSLIPSVKKLGFDVVVLTGDHSTPAILKGHSWHPNPLLLWSPYVIPEQGEARFTERCCARGVLGRMPATEVMPLLLAHSLKLKKFGA